MGKIDQRNNIKREKKKFTQAWDLFLGEVAGSVSGRAFPAKRGSDENGAGPASKKPRI